MIIAADRKVIWANDACERALGYPTEELVGREVFPLIHVDDARAVAATIERVSTEPGARGRVDFRLRAADGDWHWMESAGTNLLSAPGVEGFVVSMRDVTEQRNVSLELSASESRYRALIDRARDAVYTASECGHLTSVNSAAEALTGFSKAELIGMDFLDLLAPEERSRAEEVVARRFAGGPDETSEFIMVAKNGRRMFVEVAWRLIESNGEPAHFEGFARDMTDRHVLEERLRYQALHDELTAAWPTGRCCSTVSDRRSPGESGTTTESP